MATAPKRKDLLRYVVRVLFLSVIIPVIGQLS